MSSNSKWEQLVEAICQPPRDVSYDAEDLLGGSREEFQFAGARVARQDLVVVNRVGLGLACSHFRPVVQAASSRSRQPCVVYTHRLGASRREAAEAVLLLLPLGVSVFTFDFSGSGVSGGEWVTQGVREADDLDCVLEYLEAAGQVSVLGMWGRGMGAVAGLLCKRRDQCLKAMVLDGPFCRPQDVVEQAAAHIDLHLPRYLVKQVTAAARRAVLKRTGVDIAAASPLDQARTCTMPAMFGLSTETPHFSQLHTVYSGDKSIIYFQGSASTPRPPRFYHSVASFLLHHLPPSATPRAAPLSLDDLHTHCDLVAKFLNDGMLGLQLGTSLPSSAPHSPQSRTLDRTSAPTSHLNPTYNLSVSPLHSLEYPNHVPFDPTPPAAPPTKPLSSTTAPPPALHAPAQTTEPLHSAAPPPSSTASNTSLHTPSRTPPSPRSASDPTPSPPILSPRPNPSPTTPPLPAHNLPLPSPTTPQTPTDLPHTPTSPSSAIRTPPHLDLPAISTPSSNPPSTWSLVSSVPTSNGLITCESAGDSPRRHYRYRLIPHGSPPTHPPCSPKISDTLAGLLSQLHTDPDPDAPAADGFDSDDTCSPALIAPEPAAIHTAGLQLLPAAIRQSTALDGPEGVEKNGSHFAPGDENDDDASSGASTCAPSRSAPPTHNLPSLRSLHTSLPAHPSFSFPRSTSNPPPAAHTAPLQTPPAATAVPRTSSLRRTLSLLTSLTSPRSHTPAYSPAVPQPTPTTTLQPIALLPSQTPIQPHRKPFRPAALHAIPLPTSPPMPDSSSSTTPRPSTPTRTPNLPSSSPPLPIPSTTPIPSSTRTRRTPKTLRPTSPKTTPSTIANKSRSWTTTSPTPRQKQASGKEAEQGRVAAMVQKLAETGCLRTGCAPTRKSLRSRKQGSKQGSLPSSPVALPPQQGSLPCSPVSLPPQQSSLPSSPVALPLSPVSLPPQQGSLPSSPVAYAPHQPELRGPALAPGSTMVHQQAVSLQGAPSLQQQGRTDQPAVPEAPTKLQAVQGWLRTGSGKGQKVMQAWTCGTRKEDVM